MHVKLSGLVTALAGSMGGVTFSRSPHGTVARAKPLPIRRTSGPSATARQRMSTLNQLWRTISPTDRADWDDFAGTVSWFNRFGDPVTGSGYMAFLKCNMASHASAASIAADTFQLTYPHVTASVLPANLQFVFDFAGGTMSMKSSDTDTDADTFIHLFASPPVPAGRSVYHRAMPYLTMQIQSKPTSIPLTSLYTDLFGRIPDKNVLETAFLRVQASNATTHWPGISATVQMEYQ